MKSVLFQWGVLTIYSYGTVLALAFILVLVLMVHRGKKHGMSPQMIYDLNVFIIVGGLIGARLAYVILNWEEFSHQPLEILMIHRGGLVFYGSLLGGMLFLWIYLKRHKMPFLKMADLMAPLLALGHGIGRLGCFLNGCCYGRPTQSFLAVNFPQKSLPAQHYGPENLLHPTQLYEMGTLIILFIILQWHDRHKEFEGQTFLCYLMFYPVVRFFMEFLRGDNPFVIPEVLTVYQVVSIGLFGVGLILYLKLKNKKNVSSVH